MKDSHVGWGGALFCSASIFAVSPALGAAPTVDGAAGAQLQEVVVTAQRRAENQQTVPITVTTLTASTLAKSGVTSTDELLSVTPGLVMTRQLRGSTPFIRGVGTQSTTPGNEAPVAQYVDGVYFMAPIGNIFSFNNIDRIEVLKGPQGTLFGRNATGGLINVITRDPKATPSFDGSVTYGSYNTWSTSLYATGGKRDVAVDVAAYSIKQTKGYGHNLLTGANVNRLNESAIRGKLLWTPTSNDRLTLSADYGTNKSDMGLVRNAVPGSLLIGRTPFRGTAFDTQGGFPTTVQHFSAWGASAKYVHDFGWANFQSLTAYRSQDSRITLDQDATPLRVVDVVINERNNWGQQEFLLVGNTHRVDWTTGVFLFAAKSEYRPLAVGSTLIPGQNTATFGRQKTRSYAAFAQATYSLTNATRFTAGARYTVDKRIFDGRTLAAVGSPLPVGTPLLTAASEKRYPKLTWRFAVDQKLSDDVMLYASYSRGFKSGTFNTGSIASPSVAPEVLDAAEAGMKSEFLHHTVRVNVSGFHYEYKNMQLSRVLNGTILVLNAAAGKVNGVDLESSLVAPVPAGDLQLNFGASWLDAHYSSFPNGPKSVPNAAGGNSTIAVDLTGNRMIRSPKWIVTAGFDYKLPLGPGAVDATFNYYYNSGFFWEPDNRLKQVAYHTMNAQLAYDFGPDNRYVVRVFGKNLSNALYGSYVSAGALGDEAAMAPPRTLGVGVDVHF